MQRLSPRNTRLRPARPVSRTLTVCVVDPNADDYQGWQATAEARGLRLQFVASAEEALRIARSERVDLWVVNTELHELSGSELCSMLKVRDSRTAVYLVADEYSPESELAAWMSRATMFGVKPMHTAETQQWLAHRCNADGESRD